AGGPEHDGNRVGHPGHCDELDTTPAIADDHRERVLACGLVGLAVAEVVDDEDVRRKRRGGKAGDDRREWERSIGNPEREGLSESGGLYVVGAGDGDQPEEDEHEEVAQSI